MKNEKYEITDIAHEKYPFLHRIRALRAIGPGVKAGDLGGFVESESNLSYEAGDDAWLYDDAVSAGTAFVDKNSRLRDQAVACERAYVSQGSIMHDNTRAEDSAYLRGALLERNARASGNSMILDSPDTGLHPCLSGNCAVYGTVMGSIQIKGSAVVFGSEEIRNDSMDSYVISNQGRSIVRDPSRDELAPMPQGDEREHNHHRKQGLTR